MSYPRQQTVSKRLHLESIRALESLGARHYSKLDQIWQRTRRELKMSVMEAYRMAAGNNGWTLPRFRHSGAESKFRAETHSIMEQFRAASTVAMKQSFNDLYKQSLLRHAWILDQVTPESRHVRIPHREMLHEAAVHALYLRASQGDDWQMRWNSWLDAYRDALHHNVGLEALNDGSMMDAADEVDATKVNTPASTLDNALSRIFEFEGTYAIAQGEEDVAMLNDDLVEEEIWKTRGDLRVCDDCDANEGQTAEEADGDIPLHPNCHCYWLIVPKSYADLLRSGDEYDNQLAEEMLYKGLVPNALAVRDDDGDVVAKIIVDFQNWVEGATRAISTQ